MLVKKRASGPAIDRQKLGSLRVIEKPGDSEYPAYAHIYIDLLPDDGLVLQHLAESLEQTRNLVASLPRLACFIAMRQINGPSKRSSVISSTMNASTFTAPFGLRAM